MLKKIAKIFSNEYVFSVVAKITMVATGMIYSILLARYLGATLKGSITYIQSIIAIGSIILSFGMHQAYPYYRKRNTDSNFLSIYMSSIITLFGFYIVLALLVAYCWRGNTEIMLATILMPLWAYTRISGYVMLVETPNKRNKALMTFSCLEVVYIAILYIFTKSNLILGISAIVFVELCKTVYFTYKIPFKYKFHFVKLYMLKQLITYGFFPMIALLMTTLNYRVDVLMLKSSAGITMAQVGIYSIGCSLAEKVLLIPDAIKEILLSKLSKGKGPVEVATVSRICFVVSICVAVCIVTLGSPFISVFYGSEYNGAYSVTAISLAGTIFMVFFKMITQYNIVNKKQLLNVIFLSISIVTNIILNALLIPSWGINGAAFATAVGYFVCAFVFVVYFSRSTKIPIKDIVIIKKSDLKMILRK